LIIHYNTIIIGAGPAGLMAAIESYHPDKTTVVLERTTIPSMKFKMTGKGRCNITNSAPLDEFLTHFGKNHRFLRYAFHEFFNNELLKYFTDLGVQIKLERGGRYFPVSDKAIEVVNAMLEKVKSLNIPLHVGKKVDKIIVQDDGTFKVIVKPVNKSDESIGKTIEYTADVVLIAMGGKSYPRTGSTGMGYKLAKDLGHKIISPTPALVSLVTAGKTAKHLQGLSLKNVQVNVWCENKKSDERFGEMLFTDKGVSGPIILSLSKNIILQLLEDKSVFISIDFKPALDDKQLDARLLREINEHGNQNFSSLLKSLLPRKLISVFVDKLGLDADKLLNQITSNDRKRIRLLLKDFRMEVTGYGSYDEAIVTAGGVSIKDINPKTMESRKVKNLYFAGEIIDIDADTGGYNIQGAFSTGWVAGKSIRDKWNYI